MLKNSRFENDHMIWKVCGRRRGGFLSPWGDGAAVTSVRLVARREAVRGERGRRGRRRPVGAAPVRAAVRQGAYRTVTIAWLRRRVIQWRLIPPSCQSNSRRPPPSYNNRAVRTPIGCPGYIDAEVSRISFLSARLDLGPVSPLSGTGSLNDSNSNSELTFVENATYPQLRLRISVK